MNTIFVLLAHLPFYVQWYRFNMFWRYGDGLLPFLRKDPDWPHPERAVNRGNDRHREELTNFILSELKDRPDLIEKCVPTYPVYGRRILLDNNARSEFQPRAWRQRDLSIRMPEPLHHGLPRRNDGARYRRQTPSTNN